MDLFLGAKEELSLHTPRLVPWMDNLHDNAQLGGEWNCIVTRNMPAIWGWFLALQMPIERCFLSNRIKYHYSILVHLELPAQWLLSSPPHQKGSSGRNSDAPPKAS
jgi:hypothetical protein